MGPKHKKERSFIWTESMTKQLLLICQEFQKKNGEEHPFLWVDIAEKFQEKTEKECSTTVARNKFEHLKTIWRHWSDLRFKETGVGWNAITGQVTVDDSWWEKKIKEKPKYNRFRKKGAAPELSDLWDSVFGSIVATGKHCVAATMDPSEVQMEEAESEFEVEAVEGEEEEEEEEEEEGTQANTIDLSSLNVDGTCDEILQSAHDVVTTVDKPTQSKGKRSAPTAPCPTMPNKRKKRPSSGSTLDQQHLEMMGQASQKLFSMFEGQGCSSEAPSGKKPYELDDVVPIIDQMVVDGSLLEGSQLWCFAMTEVMK